MYQNKPNLAMRIINRLINMRWFPTGSHAKIGLGLWWIVEPFIIEIPIATYFLTKYQWEIIGPVNLGLFTSTLFTVIYGALCLGAGYIQWQIERAKAKKL